MLKKDNEKKTLEQEHPAKIEETEEEKESESHEQQQKNNNMKNIKRSNLRYRLTKVVIPI